MWNHERRKSSSPTAPFEKLPPAYPGAVESLAEQMFRIPMADPARVHEACDDLILVRRHGRISGIGWCPDMLGTESSCRIVPEVAIWHVEA